MSDAMYAAASLYNDERYFSRSEIRIRNNKIRRNRIVRRQFTALIAVITVILIALVFTATSLSTDAQSEVYAPEFKYYKNVTVTYGDSLWDIAKANYPSEHYKSINSYISEICSVNHISEADMLRAGENIIIPYYSTEFK